MPASTKISLLNSAEGAARARGFHGFSYADLAEDVGIRKASIHHHFPTKAALSVALVQRYCKVFQVTCTEIEAQHSTGGARLSALIELYRDALQGGKSLCLCVALSSNRDSLPAEVITEIAGFRKMIVTWLEAAFLAGDADASIASVAVPAMEAAATLSVLEGAQLAARAEEDMALFDGAVALLRSRIA